MLSCGLEQGGSEDTVQVDALLATADIIAMRANIADELAEVTTSGDWVGLQRKFQKLQRSQYQTGGTAGVIVDDGYDALDPPSGGTSYHRHEIPSPARRLGTRGAVDTVVASRGSSLRPPARLLRPLSRPNSSSAASRRPGQRLAGASQRPGADLGVSERPRLIPPLDLAPERVVGTSRGGDGSNSNSSSRSTRSMTVPSLPQQALLGGTAEPPRSNVQSLQHLHSTNSRASQSSESAKPVPRRTESEHLQTRVKVKKRALSMWKVYLKHERTHRLNLYSDAVSFVLHFCLLLTVYLYMPVQTTLLTQKLALEDLLLDEEFTTRGAFFKKNWHDVMTTEELWQWAEGPLTNAFFDSDLADTSNVTSIDAALPQPALFSNRLLGSVHVRQSRVAPTACPSVATVLFPGELCAPAWMPGRSARAGSRAQYLAVCAQDVACTQFESMWGGYYQDHPSHRTGHVNLVKQHFDYGSNFDDGSNFDYGSDGWSVLLPRNLTLWQQRLKQMEESNFIDKFTRMISFTLNIYDANDHDDDVGMSWSEGEKSNDVGQDDQLMVVQLNVLIDPSGHFEKYTRFIPLRPMRDWLYADTTTMKVAFWLWVASTAYLIYLEADEFYDYGAKVYFSTGSQAMWNRFELVYFSVVLWTLYRTVQFKWASEDALAGLQQYHATTDLNLSQCTKLLNPPSTCYYDLGELVIRYSNWRDIMAWMLALAVFKLFKFMSLSQRLSFLWRVIMSARQEIAAFVLVFGILLASFSLFATQAFGWQDRHFHNFATASMSLLRLSIGDFEVLDYIKIKTENPSNVPIFFTVFSFLIILFVINMFIAILSEHFAKVKREMHKYSVDKNLLLDRGIRIVTYSLSKHWRRLLGDVLLKWKCEFHFKEPPVGVTAVRHVIGRAAWEAAGGGKSNRDGKTVAAHIVRLHFSSKFIPSAASQRRTTGRLDRNVGSNMWDDFGSSGMNTKGTKTKEADWPHKGVTTVVMLKLQTAFMTQAKKSHILKVLQTGDTCKLEHKGLLGTAMNLRFLSLSDERIKTDDGETVNIFADFEVENVVSWNTFRDTTEPTELTVRSSTWTEVEDKALWNIMVANDALPQGDPLWVTDQQIADTFNRSTASIQSRFRFLKDSSMKVNSRMVPRVLNEQFSVPIRFGIVLWWRALHSDKVSDVGASASVSFIYKKFLRINTGVTRDLKYFIDEQIKSVQSRCNMRDLEQTEKMFDAENLALDAFVYKMALFLYKSKWRSKKYLDEVYGKDGKGHADVERYLMKHYSHEMTMITEVVASDKVIKVIQEDGLEELEPEVAQALAILSDIPQLQDLDLIDMRNIAYLAVLQELDGRAPDPVVSQKDTVEALLVVVEGTLVAYRSADDSPRKARSHGLHRQRKVASAVRTGGSPGGIRGEMYGPGCILDIDVLVHASSQLPRSHDASLWVDGEGCKVLMLYREDFLNSVSADQVAMLRDSQLQFLPRSGACSDLLMPEVSRHSGSQNQSHLDATTGSHSAMSPPVRRGTDARESFASRTGSTRRRPGTPVRVGRGRPGVSASSLNAV